MDVNDFLNQLELLTGTPVKDVADSERSLIAGILSDGERPVDWRQFNELLLSLNKDRVQRPFFEFFFCSEGATNTGLCQIKDLPLGIERFRKAAMLCFGNFIYAYRILSKVPTEQDLKSELGEHCASSEKLLDALRGRLDKMIDTEPISREDTYLTGYLSVREIVADNQRAKFLAEILDKNKDISWTEIKDAILANRKGAEAKELVALVARFRRLQGEKATTEDLRQRLSKDLPQLEEMKQRLTRIQLQAEHNTDVYLTWDHMDIYFATSMRKRWEFEDLFDFLADLFKEEALSDLKIRYFDPTQSFEKNRIDKGLIESLMLKRAACTVYSVQDTDTLGKDSELAATLAQGKAVIAYVPEIEIPERTDRLLIQRPLALRERLNFVFYAYEEFTSEFSEDRSFINEFVLKLDTFEETILWKSISDDEADTKFREENTESLKKFCNIIARAEQQIYSKRARTLIESHPLAIQVNLRTGVANGVLVVRTPKKCAELLRAILLNQLDFEIKDDPNTECWLLLEKSTQSIYRVVTKNRKLTNCFWNFYRDGKVKESDARQREEC
ncbi:MAG: hypothetical protein ACMG6H_07675 [Acidobacteriota bacterium]